MHGLKEGQIAISNAVVGDGAAIHHGVRELDRQVAQIHRKVAITRPFWNGCLVSHQESTIKVLGQPKFEYGVREKETKWAGEGLGCRGGTLKDIEVAAVPGKS